MESYTEEDVLLDDALLVGKEGSGGVTWKTTRCLHILQMPRFFLGTLDRFAYSPTEGERILKCATMDISAHLTVHGQDYRLMGGVIHVSASAESMAEEGHYVTLMAVKNGDDTTLDSWCFIDDESSRWMDTETAHRYLRGTETEDGTYYCAVLVLYSRHYESEEDDDDMMDDTTGWTKVAAALRDEYTAIYADWSNPESLVGRKLNVSWAKGRWYSGIVDSYDGTSGKHRVLYDDGDVREYDLQKKTVQWL